MGSTTDWTAVILAALLSLAVAGAAETEGKTPEPPEPAPPLDFETSLTGPPPENLTWEALRGRAAVIEFWATWCAPCVQAIPHWNELVESFSDEEIVFVSVTDENEERVRGFLESRPIFGSVVLDTDRDTFDAYGVRGIPHTVLVDAEGRIRAVTRPSDLEEKHLRVLLAGETPDIAPRRDIPATIEKKLGGVEGEEPLVRAMIRTAASDEMMMMMGTDRWVALAAKPPQAISVAWDFPSTRIVGPEDLMSFRYDFVFTGFDDEEIRKTVMRNLIAEALNLEARRESRQVDVWILDRRPGEDLGFPASEGYAGGTRAEPGQLSLVNMDLGRLARMLEFLLDRPVIDETDVSGKFDVELEWKADDLASLRTALEEAGLTLEEGIRKVEFLVLEKQEEDATDEEHSHGE
ncbi:MAG: TIGR03435 family protein [Thermoanaerobaculia bacterium]|nr:TIGR03435 family protein [Thermoanaerobaculia bacterium]